MPIYDWECKDCQVVTEVQHKSTDSSHLPPYACRGCNGKNLFKIISKTSFSLKGQGWFSDGYELKSDTAEFKNRRKR